MKKVSVVTLKPLEQQTLEQLRDLGVLHIFTEQQIEHDRSDSLREQYAAIERTLTVIPPKEDESAVSDIGMSGDEAVDAGLTLSEQTQKIVDERTQLTDERDRLQREIERFTPWGDPLPERIAELEDAGIQIRLYELTKEVADQLIPELPYVIEIERSKTVVRCVGIATASQTLPAEPLPLELPAMSVSDMAARVEEIDSLRAGINARLTDMSGQRPMLQAALAQLEIDLEFCRVEGSMDSHKELSWITGFVPAENVGTVRDAASENGWGVVVRDPEPDEYVPTKIKNPKPVRIIKPVFDLLGTVPGYRELDISFFFLLFFVVFFAMIIGDGGYGVILLVGTVAAAIRGKRRGNPPGPGTALMVVLSSATVAWGAITGNWFGYGPFAELPVLRDLVIPAISVDNESSTQTIQYLTFVIGTIHLSIAHIWNFFRGLRRKPFIAAFEQLGWLSMVLGLYYLVLDMVLGTVAVSIVPRPDWWLAMIGGGLAAVMAFGRQESGQNFFVGLFKGVANIITTALDGISAFSDIISYIRLFAVGLASLAIAESFNAMAGGVAESLGGAGGAVAAVLILFLGHTLNLAMGALSVVVHGVRLNMLEFSGHLGMEWTGVEYSPFKTR